MKKFGKRLFPTLKIYKKIMEKFLFLKSFLAYNAAIIKNDNFKKTTIKIIAQK